MRHRGERCTLGVLAFGIDYSHIEAAGKKCAVTLDGPLLGTPSHQYSRSSAANAHDASIVALGGS